MNPVVAVDFDGTIVTVGEPPDIGKDNGAAPYLNLLAAAGVRIVLWTARRGSDLDEAVEWCRLRGVPVHVHDLGSKPRFDVVVDDLALGCPTKVVDGKRAVDWDVAGPALLRAVADLR